MAERPTDDTLALVAYLLGREWLAADEIRHALGRLGFKVPSSQWVASHLTAMTKEDSPRFESGFREYRVTSWAVTGLSNQWDGFSSLAAHTGRNLPTPFPRADAKAKAALTATRKEQGDG